MDTLLRYVHLSPLKSLIALLLIPFTSILPQNLHEYLGQDKMYVTSRLGEPKIQQKDHISYTDYKRAWHFYYKRSGSSVFNRIELIVFAKSRTDAQNKWASLSDEFARQYGFSPIDVDVEKHVCTLEKDNKTAEITIKTNTEKTVFAVRADLRLNDTEPVLNGYNDLISKISQELKQFRKYIGNSAEDIFRERGTPDSYGNHMASYDGDQFSYEFHYDRGIVGQCEFKLITKSKSEAASIYTEISKFLKSSGSSKMKGGRMNGNEGHWTEWRKNNELINISYYKDKDTWTLGLRLMNQN